MNKWLPKMVYECKNLSERLRLALEILKISQTELAKRINVKPQVIQYLTSANSEKSKFTFPIAETLNIDVNWLATGKGQLPSCQKAEASKRKIPVFQINQVTDVKVKRNKIDNEIIHNWIIIGEETNINSFAIIINDKAMAPRFDIDTLIIIDPEVKGEQLKENSLVLAYLHDEDYCVFRQLDNRSKTLIPMNTTIYKEILLTNKDLILGTCKEARWNIL